MLLFAGVEEVLLLWEVLLLPTAKAMGGVLLAPLLLLLLLLLGFLLAPLEVADEDEDEAFFPLDEGLW